MSATTWRFRAVDTWFFRESRPLGALGGSELGSLFPPPARTLAGAVRTLMGERLGIDWHAFARGNGVVGDVDLIAEIGLGDGLGKLRLGGPWLARTNGTGARERLYPAPRFVLARPQPAEGSPELVPLRLRVGPVEHCDLGRVRLPMVPSAAGVRAKALENVWLTGAGLERVLAGERPRAEDLVKLSAVYAEESRLGIARDNASRTNRESMLYQTRHVRPMPELSVEVDVSGVDPRLLEPWPVAKLGGEGRLAEVRRLEEPAGFPAAPAPDAETVGMILCLLTPADCDGGWLPPGFEPAPAGATTTWHGALHGIELELHAAVVGKPVREGGWDLARKRPRAVRSLVPAGSAWYCTVRDGSPADAIDALHGASLGRDSDLGRGRLAVALWKKSEDVQGGSSPS